MQRNKKLKINFTNQNEIIYQIQFTNANLSTIYYINHQELKKC